jgi:LysR family transcriptional regulator for metE and metH
MYLELRHFRTLRAIQEAGGLARAAEMLNTTQSALSHQVAGLEDQVGMELFVRRSKPMRLSAAGTRMLKVAERILPEIAALEEEFRALLSG